jgi:hypothetical protein
VAKVTDEFCRKRFYLRFAKMTKPEQRGIMEAFATIMDLTAVEPEADDAPLLEEADNGSGS